MSGNYIGSGPAPGGMILVGDTNPVGMVNWFHAVPDGSWLQLNGQIVAKATYPNLWTWAQGFLTADQTVNPGLYRNVDANTFALPNLQGLFLRSVGQVDAQHVAAALGVKQMDATRTPTSAPAGQTSIWTGGASGGFVNVSTGAGANHGNFAADPESRPVNVALVPCVKAKRTTLVATPGLLPGRLLQVQSHLRGDPATGVTAIPIDNTIPQITEGTQFFTVTITPQQVGSRLRLRCMANVAADAIATTAGALFRVGQANALASGFTTQRGAGDILQLGIETEVVPADLSPLTFTARFGGTAAVRLNGSGVSDYMGGSFASFLKVEEYST